jgi:hypothetical protein
MADILDSMVRDIRRHISLPLPRRRKPSRLAQLPHLHHRIRRRSGTRHPRCLRLDPWNWCWCRLCLFHCQHDHRTLRSQDTRYPCATFLG